MTRNQAWTTDRIYYARTPAETAAWKRHLESSDRLALRHVNFSSFGILAVFLTSRDEFSAGPVFLAKDGLSVQISSQPRAPRTCGTGGGSCLAIPQMPQYVLFQIGKGSLPKPVQRLYVNDTPPSPVPDECGWCPQTRWTLLSSGFHVGNVRSWTTNQIYYAGTRKQAREWKAYLPPEQRQLLGTINFSRFGLLAIFTPSTTQCLSVKAVFPMQQALRAEISLGCGLISLPLFRPKYALIRIEKATVPAPLQVLYLTEVG